MSETEQVREMITKYMDLQRIQKSEDREREIRNQLRETRAILEAMGVVTEYLTIE